MQESIPILYVKTGCPWCQEAIAFLDRRGIAYQEKNVSTDDGAIQEMQRKSGQTYAPTLDWHGQILADFGVEELRAFLAQHAGSPVAGS